MMITTLTTTTARITSPTTSTSTPMTAFAAAITAAGAAPSVDRFEHALLDRPSLGLLIRELQLVIDYIDQVAQRGLYAHWTCWTPPSASLSRSLPTVLPQYEHNSGADSGADSGAEADSAAAAIEAHLKVDVEGGKAACSRFWAIAAAFEADRQVIFSRSGNGHNGEVEALKKLLLLLKHEGDDLVEQWQVMVRHVDHELTTHWPAPLFLCGCLPTAAAAAAKKNMIEK